jgi:hypothetical protein
VPVRSGLTPEMPRSISDDLTAAPRQTGYLAIGDTAGYPVVVATELIILPTAYRHQITEDQIRHALANGVDVFEGQGDIPLTIITGPGDNRGELVIEVGFEVSESGNVVFYHGMAARPKYR